MVCISGEFSLNCIQMSLRHQASSSSRWLSTDYFYNMLRWTMAHVERPQESKTTISIMALYRRIHMAQSMVHSRLDTSWGRATTEWFKINLTLFKSHISHKWRNIMDLFEDIHKGWYLSRIWWKWHQNWCWNNEMGVLFWQIVKNYFTRM